MHLNTPKRKLFPNKFFNLLPLCGYPEMSRIFSYYHIPSQYTISHIPSTYTLYIYYITYTSTYTLYIYIYIYPLHIPSQFTISHIPHIPYTTYHIAYTTSHIHLAYTLYTHFSFFLYNTY